MIDNSKKKRKAEKEPNLQEKESKTQEKSPRYKKGV